jgi:hypothetical protein
MSDAQAEPAEEVDAARMLLGEPEPVGGRSEGQAQAEAAELHHSAYCTGMTGQFSNNLTASTPCKGNTGKD